jgi:hypothetical protein
VLLNSEVGGFACNARLHGREADLWKVPARNIALALDGIV